MEVKDVILLHKCPAITYRDRRLPWKVRQWTHPVTLTKAASMLLSFCTSGMAASHSSPKCSLEVILRCVGWGSAACILQHREWKMQESFEVSLADGQLTSLMFM